MCDGMRVPVRDFLGFPLLPVVCPRIRETIHLKCCNREIGRDSLEERVLEHLSKLVFADKVIPDIIKYYNEYQRERNKDSIDILKNYKQQIKKLEKKIDNVVQVISQTASMALSEKLQALESEKFSIEINIHQLEREQSENHVTEDDLKKAFRKARKLLESKDLENTKELMQTFVEQVLMFPDRIEISFNIGIPSDVFKKPDIEKSHYPMPAKANDSAIFCQPPRNSHAMEAVAEKEGVEPSHGLPRLKL